MDKLTLKKELANKIELIESLRLELEETNKGILYLVMELEQAAEPKEFEGKAVIELLQNELEQTDHGLLALNAELELAKDKYRNIIEHAREAIITFDITLNIKTCNEATTKLFGYENNALITMTLSELVPYFDQFFNDENNFGQLESGYLKTQHGDGPELCGQHKSNFKFPIEMTIGSPFYDEKKTWMVIIRDITKRMQADQRLRLLAKIFKDSNDAILITDTEGVIVDVNEAYTAITGFSRQEALGKKSNILQSGQHDEDFYRSMWESLTALGYWSGEIWDKKKNGDIYPKWLSISSVKDAKNATSHYVGTFTDITVRKEIEHKLQQLAHYDQLTGLPNRAVFLEKLQCFLDLAQRNNQHLALMFLDLDRFKIINDTLGHHVGDQLLVEVAERLSLATRKTDLVSRLAGDEFTIVISELNDKNDIEEIATKILQLLVKPVNLGEREIFISASLGIAVYPYDGEETYTLLKNADLAMYHAKTKGKNIYAFYSSAMNAKFENELELEGNIRRALPNGEFTLVYQPQLRLSDQQIVGVEVLIRWRHPTIGFISPMLFIPIAEQTGLIIHIGDWVLKTACNQFVQWQKRGLPPIKLSVNYSGVQLKQSNQIENITAILAETEMDPRYLCLEMTESVAMDDAENTSITLQAFKDMGISISIDDFGTGYSSLSYLKRFPIDMLKIDRSFIDNIIDDPDDSAIASTIIAIAHQLRLSVIAEGVETKEQLEFLKNKGCDLIQGYYYCPPIPNTEFVEFMLNHGDK